MAAMCGYFNIVKYILQNDPSAHNLKDHRGQIPLHMAAQNGHLAVVESILQTDKSIDFRVKTSDGQNIINIAPADKKIEITNLLKNHLLYLHQTDPDGQHIQCPICLEAATECLQCSDTTKPTHLLTPLERIRLTPCCLKVLCEHDFRHQLKLGILTCPYCRGVWTISQ